MKPEPLTEKKMKCLVSDGNISFEPAFKKDIGKITVLFDYKDVKSAVEWLLKEIEKEERKTKRRISNLITECSEEDYLQGFLNGLKTSKDLIKKAFEGVIDE